MTMICANKYKEENFSHCRSSLLYICRSSLLYKVKIKFMFQMGNV
jgi:hypothetical protein